MLRRLAREEAGITMALTVVMIVLISVMGAGLLVFIQRDLNSVIEVNRGQKASEAAETGVQAAKRQVLASSFPSQYNDTSLPPSLPSDPANSEWAFNSASAPCGGLPSGPGKCIITAEGNTRVTIRYLPPPTSTSGTGSRNDPKYAPENSPTGLGTDYPDKRDYFRIDSEGYSGGTYRKIQAIYVTGDLGLPISYFATEDITFSGGATNINNVSFFAKGDITGVRSGLLTGTDSAYGDWAIPGYNNKARLARSGTGFDPESPLSSATGVAAEGTITYDPTPYNTTQTQAPAENSDRYKRIDFDSRASLSGTTAPTNPTPNYRFCAKGTACWPTGTEQPADVITYPFNSKTKFDDKLLQNIAQQQVRPGAGSASSRDNYVEQSGSASTVLIDETTFYQISPALSSVYVVRFTGLTKGVVDIKPTTGSSTACPIKGIILVINGDVTTSSSGGRCFDGVISVQDPNNQGLNYISSGNFTLNGFVNIEGSMTIAGSTNPVLGDDILSQPGFHTVKLWSWRECYSTTCT